MLICMETNLGNYIRQMREQRGWTLDTLGRKLGRPSTWVFNLEKGNRKNLPEPEELRALAAALGVSHLDLLEAAGYLTPEDRQQVNANPFPRDDIRYRLVEELKRLDLDGPDGGFWTDHFRLELRMLRDVARHGLSDLDDDLDLATMETVRTVDHFADDAG